MRLLFNQYKLPRSMTRREWREIDRWRRVTQKKLIEAEKTSLDAFLVFGTDMPREMRDRTLDRLVHQPVLIRDDGLGL